jgi:hypothetical protein
MVLMGLMGLQLCYLHLTGLMGLGHLVALLLLMVLGHLVALLLLLVL